MTTLMVSFRNEQWTKIEYFRYTRYTKNLYCNLVLGIRPAIKSLVYLSYLI